MSLESTPLFGMMQVKMNWLTQRQRVLSQNIANSDTPGYRSKDLVGINFREELRNTEKRISLSQTSEGHIKGHSDTSSHKSFRTKQPYEFAPDGNGVVVEEQMMKMHETGADYKLATSLFSKYTNLYNIALGSGGGR
ncbi:flagellar basal body rod protein FlgB [Aestuariispira insulae]|uniref:Flagellar basal body rod protein FlgB n=1 Tax=Aestuariispira insulae TaxID=1461337 RepID=A0A3D9HSI9_9PROT|nr:flagellar basal body rod protein FlgB [Aestuariispira insulae]RED52473.1 flagellar basal-body rod protein FlgB [Aestuariispira insulae]